MKIKLPKVALLVIGALAFPAAALFAADQRSYTAANVALSIDGVPYDGLLALQGGEFVADIVTENATAGAVPKKHVSNVHIAPITVDLEYAPTNALVGLLNDFLTNRPTTHTVGITRLDFNKQPAAGSFEALNATLIAADFGEFSGDSKVAAHFTLVFQPEQVRAVSPAAGGAPKSNPKSKNALASNFRFSMDPLPGNRVAKVAGLTVKRTLSADAIGIFREPSAHPAMIEFTNLLLEVSYADIAPWDNWANDYMVAGHHLESDEKSATLTLLAPNMKDPIMAFQFTHVGLVRLARQPFERASDKVQRFEVELYYEGMAVTTTGMEAAGGTSGTSAPPGTTTATTATAAPPAGSTATASDTVADPIGATALPAGGKVLDPNLTSGIGPLGAAAAGTNPVLVAAQPPAIAAPPTSKLGVAPAARTIPAGTAGAVGTSPTSLAAAATNPADQGARDPVDCPRIDGLLRKSYYSSHAESSLEEDATYSTKLAIDDVVAKYDEALKSAGWEETRKSESGNAADFTHYYRLVWTKTVQTIDLKLTQTKGGAEVSLTVSANRVGVLSALAAALKGINPDVAPAEGSPADQGARDPADFPRISRSVRKSYSAYGSAKAPEETAVYRAKLPIIQAEGFFVNRLRDADWEQNIRRESGDPFGGSHEIGINWKLSRRSARISLKEIEPEITEISLYLSTTAP